MRALIKPFSLFMIVTLLLAACAKITTPTESSPGITKPGEAEAGVLYLNLTWHQHQPLYYKDETGTYTRPWVRVHATKDYYDMVAMIQQYPNVRMTVNITPVLMKQLDDFVLNGAKDYYWLLAEKPAADLTYDEKVYMLTRFFDANWDNVIYRFPRYKELLNLRGGTTEEEIERSVFIYTEQDFRDLQFWFNLAWIDPDFLSEPPLKELVEKGENFSEDEKEILFSEIRSIMSQVIPLHVQMQDSGQLEVITTPYAHPILPLIYNSNVATIGNPAGEQPERFSWPNDAIAHLEKSVEIYKDQFGRAPVGLWPGEGAVSEDIVPLVARAGYKYMQTGEIVLAQSLGLGSFSRDALETVQEADDLYRPYYLKTEDGSKVAIFFRDLILSDKLGFTYSQTPGEDAAADLMKRLEDIRIKLVEQNAEGPNIVSIILDGENAWEYYPNDGKEFLNAMYRMLNESETIRMVTPSQYLEMFPEQRELDTLFPGAWFSPNYDTWIGEPEETMAWEYLGRVRNFLAKYDVSGTREASPEAIAQAQDYMYLAEGSDWFWWYGSDQDSGVDEYFDEGFRALLAGVYRSLDEPVPAFLSVPIIPKKPEVPSRNFSGASTPIIDGLAGDTEWANAAEYLVKNEGPITRLAYTLDKKNIYLRMDFTGPILPSQEVGIYLDIPSGEMNYPFALSKVGLEDLQLGIAATHLFKGNADKLISYSASSLGWQENPNTEGDWKNGTDLLEVAIPLDGLGDISAGDDIRIVVICEPENQLVPSKGPAQIILPDLGLTDLVYEVIDPAGDDHGPGSYVYPTDGVFSPQNFDISNFTISTDQKNIIFTFRFFGPVPNPWGSGSYLSLQTLDVYIDKDPGGNSGNRRLLPGRNGSLASGNGWEYALWAEGWTPGIYQPDPATGEPKQTGQSFKIIVDPVQQSVSLRVPREFLGEGEPEDWGYAAMVLGQDGFPSTGVWRVRDIQSSPAQWKFGGSPDDVNHTRIIDLVWPVDFADSQENILTGYRSSTAAIGTLSDDDFAQIPILLVK